MRKLRFKQFLRERNQFSKTGDETLLSVSEYYGVKPRAEAFQSEEHESRAATLEGYRIVKKDDLVMNYMLAWKGAYGVSDHEGIVSPAYSVFKVDQNTVDVRYLHHRARSDDMKAYFRSRSKGIIDSRLRLYPDSLLASYVEIPDLATQRQIAHFLDRETARIDLLIEKKQRLVALLDDKTAAKQQSDLDNLLGTFGQSRLKNFMLAITTGPFGSAIKQDEYIEDGVPILNPAHIADGKIIHDMSITLSDEKAQELQYWRLKPGDLLMGRRGDLGRCAVVEKTLGACICGTGCLRLRVHPKHNASYLQLVISGRRSREWLDLNAVGTTMKNLNEAIVGRLPVPNVSRERQDEFVSDTQSAYRKNAHTRRKIVLSIDRLKEYRSALITAAVTGQIDVQTYARSGATDRRLDAIQEEMNA